MPVIINEFEIMVEPPGQQAAAPTTPANTPRPGESAQQPVALRPQDIERILCHFEERRHRLAAD